ncbi:hypothetical protein GCM10010326_78470 [Streptomyces xanthochromogenes]|uniref:Uncharacterized protein n=1 Tax=Streptomyces xanthochromogenes TaxID=67384 RepID=A0ABQ3B076_9ACTN|nr:hypothetical protein GCM10010326_78470 [Streptomyces xanthochromogenes]
MAPPALEARPAAAEYVPTTSSATKLRHTPNAIPPTTQTLRTPQPSPIEARFTATSPALVSDPRSFGQEAPRGDDGRPGPSGPPQAHMTLRHRTRRRKRAEATPLHPGSI